MAKKKRDIVSELSGKLRKWVEQDSSFIRKLELIRGTLFEMLKDRGYDIPQEYRQSNQQQPSSSMLDDRCVYVFERFANDDNDYEMTTTSCSTLSQKLDDNRLSVFLCMWDPNKNLSIDVVRNVIKTMNDMGMKRSIVISDVVSPSAIRCMNEAREREGLWIERFRIDELHWNRMKNEFQPKIKVLSEQERKEVIERFGGNVCDFCNISINDYECRHYGLGLDDIILCEWPNCIMYRRVVYLPGRDAIFKHKTSHCKIKSTNNDDNGDGEAETEVVIMDDN